MNVLVIILIIGYACILSAAIFTMIYIIRHRKNYITNLIVSLNIITLFNSGLIHSSLIFFSIIIFQSEALNLILWKLSIISKLFTLLISTLNFNFIYKYEKILIRPLIYFVTFFGMTIGVLIPSNSIEIVINTLSATSNFVSDPAEIIYIFNTNTRLIVTIFMLSIFLDYLYISIKIHINARDKKISKFIILNTFIFLVTHLMYILYMFFQAALYIEMYILLHWFNFITTCLILIKKPKMFLVLTNKVYFLHIYHKSGILLYSYKFSMSKNETDSISWGNLLIGLNHIISEFVNKKKNQIDMLQTKTSEIVVKYDNEHGFAVLVLTNKKNLVLENLMEKFLKEFKKRYEVELYEILDINKLITVSEFKDSKKIIEECFQIYL